LLRLPVALAAAVAAALLAAPVVAAAVVHVRVEGKTVTIFGAAEPRVSATTPLDALEQASKAGEFYVHVTSSSFGNYVDQIGLYGGSGSSGWVFKVNGVSPPVGADQLQLKDGDVVEWYYATFGPTGGPPTLVLTKVQKRCYRIVAQDDAGKTSFPNGAVLHVGTRVVKAQGAGGAAVACLTGSHGVVWATAPNAIRSNRLP